MNTSTNLERATRPEAIVVQCPVCGRRLRLAATVPASARAQCGACGAPFRVPGTRSLRPEPAPPPGPVPGPPTERPADRSPERPPDHSGDGRDTVKVPSVGAATEKTASPWWAPDDRD